MIVLNLIITFVGLLDAGFLKKYGMRIFLLSVQDYQVLDI